MERKSVAVIAARGPAREARLEALRPFAPPSLLLVAAALLFATMAVVVKVAASSVSGAEVAFVRFGIGGIACCVAATRVRFATRNRLGLLLRGAYGGAAVLCYFLAIAHLPVGVATLLNYTAPVFSALYAALFLGEPVKRATLGALTLTTAGVALVIEATAPPGSLGVGFWQLIGLGSAVLSGAAVATIREVRKTDGSWEIFAAFCAGGGLISALPAAFTWKTPRAGEWVALAVVGLLSVIAQLLMTYALRFVRAAVAGIVAQLTPVAALLMGWAFLHEGIAGLAALGAVLTLLGVIWGTRLAGVVEPAVVEES